MWIRCFYAEAFAQKTSDQSNFPHRQRNSGPQSSGSRTFRDFGDKLRRVGKTISLAGGGAGDRFDAERDSPPRTREPQIPCLQFTYHVMTSMTPSVAG